MLENYQSLPQLLDDRVITESWMSKVIRVLIRLHDLGDSSRFAANGGVAATWRDFWIGVGAPLGGGMALELWMKNIFE